MTNASAVKRQRLLKWFKRVGIGGFLFFLIKGLAWLAIGYWFARR
jgi:hypothetical protein